MSNDGKLEKCKGKKMSLVSGTSYEYQGKRTCHGCRAPRLYFSRVKTTISKKTRPSEANVASFSDLLIFLTTFHFFTLLVLPSSSSLLPPHPSFLLIPPSSSSLLPPRPSFFIIQHCPNHLESVKVHFSSILTKALPTNGPTNGRTDGQALLKRCGRI